MRMATILLLCALSWVLWTGCVPRGNDAARARSGKYYDVTFRERGGVTVDGRLDESAWRAVAARSDFSFPWRDRAAPATELQCCFDRQMFYFAFRVQDGDVVIEGPCDQETVVAREDRVEIFFSCDPELRTYYCLEIDPVGRVLDYQAHFYRQFDDRWNCPGLSVAGRRTDDGYVVEGAIPLETFRAWGMLGSTGRRSLLVGAYRAEFSYGSDGAVREEWISWVHPRSETPDFHIPSSFGRFNFP